MEPSYFRRNRGCDSLARSTHSKAKESPKLAAAIQVSQAIVSELGFTGLNKCKGPEPGSYQELDGLGNVDRGSPGA